MKAITMFEANDGSRWDNAEQALEREALIGRVEWATLPLGEMPKLPGCGFENGGGFKRHKPKDVDEAKRRLIELTRPLLASWFETQTQMGRDNFMDTHPSWFLRLLDGSAPPLEMAWRRITCIDKESREWGQPYYATHPNEAKQVEIV